mgnify:FL=1
MNNKTLIWKTQEDFLKILGKQDEVDNLSLLISQNISDLMFIKRSLIKSSEQDLLNFINTRLSELKELKGLLI